MTDLSPSRISIPWLLSQKGKEPITMLTAYDAPTTRLVDEAGVEVILVGDSLAMVVLGYETTLEVTVDDLESTSAYVGPGYGIVTEGSQRAMQLCARTEGLLLDPCYSGKTMAGLIDHIEQGRWSRDHTIVFIHTGGTPALFAYADELGLEPAGPSSA